MKKNDILTLSDDAYIILILEKCVYLIEAAYILFKKLNIKY